MGSIYYTYYKYVRIPRYTHRYTNTRPNDRHTLTQTRSHSQFIGAIHQKTHVHKTGLGVRFCGCRRHQVKSRLYTTHTSHINECTDYTFMLSHIPTNYTTSHLKDFSVWHGNCANHWYRNIAVLKSHQFLHALDFHRRVSIIIVGVAVVVVVFIVQ